MTEMIVCGGGNQTLNILDCFPQHLTGETE
jgi:hypothetical protein